MTTELLNIIHKMEANLVTRNVIIATDQPSKARCKVIDDIDEDFYNLLAALNMLCPAPSIKYYERFVKEDDIRNISQLGAQC